MFGKNFDFLKLATFAKIDISKKFYVFLWLFIHIIEKKIFVYYKLNILGETCTAVEEKRKRHQRKAV